MVPAVELLQGEDDRHGTLIVLLQAQHPRTPIRPLLIDELPRGIEQLAAQRADDLLLESIEGNPACKAARRAGEISADAE